MSGQNGLMAGGRCQARTAWASVCRRTFPPAVLAAPPTFRRSSHHAEAPLHCAGILDGLGAGGGVTRELNLRMAIPAKREAGTSALWLGLRGYAALGYSATRPPPPAPRSSRRAPSPCSSASAGSAACATSTMRSCVASCRTSSRFRSARARCATCTRRRPTAAAHHLGPPAAGGRRAG